MRDRSSYPLFLAQFLEKYYEIINYLFKVQFEYARLVVLHALDKTKTHKTFYVDAYASN